MPDIFAGPEDRAGYKTNKTFSSWSRQWIPSLSSAQISCGNSKTRVVARGMHWRWKELIRGITLYVRKLEKICKVRSHFNRDLKNINELKAIYEKNDLS